MSNNKKRKIELPSIPCSWIGCTALCNNDWELNGHIETHLETLKPDIQGKYNCVWGKCEYTTECVTQIHRHIYYHGYYNGLLVLGKYELENNKQIPRCYAPPRECDKIPELITNFRCEWTDCDRNFVSIVEFQDHIVQHASFEYEIQKSPDDERPKIQCNWNFCKKQLDNKYRLIEHIRTHSNKKQVACFHCGELFRTKTTLFDHLRRQPDNNTQKYQCAQCFKYFATEKLLRSHMIKHVNCFKCSMCDMTCSSASALATHVRYRHLKDKPFKCVECDYRCVRESDLNQHVQLVHSQEVHRCEEPGCTYAVKTFQALRRFTTKVKRCEFAVLKWSPQGTTEIKELQGYNVVCEDTILFPEGGGQPCDYGTINGEPVRNVILKGNEAVHFVETQTGFEEGMEVKQFLDWERRLDHMQQHSGQHLVTELFDKQLNYDTISWWLGTETSYIELNTTHLVSRESLDLIENKVNDIIRQGKEVNVVLLDPETFLEMNCVRAPRGLPKDIEGPVRVICIEGQRHNMCCGTHVTNLSQLQCVKLLYAEKNKNSVIVHFVVGQRVLKRLGESFQREQQLTLALKGGPLQHLDLIQKMQNNLKASKKSFQKLLKECAIAEAEKLTNMTKPLPKYFSLHRKDGIEPDFINTFLRLAPADISLYFLTVSEPGVVNQSGKGHLVLRGEPEIVQNFGGKFLDILDGKGNGKEGNYQGKFNNIDKIPECETMLEEYFKKPKTEPIVIEKGEFVHNNYRLHVKH